MSAPLHVLRLTPSGSNPDALEAELRRAGFSPRFEPVSTKAAFLGALDLDLDLILAELNVPRFPLAEALRLLQSRGHDLPVIVVADPAREPDALQALQQGASDYVLTDHLARLGPATAAALEIRRLTRAERQSLAAPAQIEPLFHSWFENSPFGLALTDGEGLLLLANPSLLRMGGYGAGALPRLRALARLFEPPESFLRIVRGMKDSHTPHQSTLYLRLADEGTREALVTAMPIRTAEGERVLWTVEDVADWVQAERSLQESRTELAEIFSAALDGILMLDAEQRILLTNPAAERIFGLTSEDLAGHPAGDVLRLGPFEPATDGASPAALPLGGTVVVGRRAWEHDFPAEVTVSRFRFRGADRFVVLARDITERQAAEAALRESEANYRGVFEGVQDAIMVQGLDGRIIDVNQRACQLYGYSRDQFLALHVPDLIHASRGPIDGQMLIELSQSGRLVETLDRRADGSAVPVQLSASVQAIAGVSRILVVARDITEAKLAEQEIRRRALHLETLNTIIAAALAPGDARTLLQVTIDHLLQALGLHAACAWSGDDWVYTGLPPGVDPAQLHRLQAALIENQGGAVITDWQSLPSGDPLEALAPETLAAGLRASLTLPIALPDRVVGGLCLAAPEPHDWSDEEVALVQAVAHQIGGAIHRLQLLHWTQGQARQLQTILDSAPEGFLVLDGTRRLRVANPLAEDYLTALVGYEPDGALATLGGRPLSSLLAPATAGRLHQVLTSDRPPRVFDVLVSPILLDLETQGWVITLREATEQQRLMQEAEQHRNLAAIGRMAAGIAHDFNNLLGPILLHSEMMRRDVSLPDRARTRLGTIQEQAQRAAELVQQILDFGRKTIMERRPLDLGAFLESQLALLHRTIPESISLSFAREGEAFTVRADSGRLQQAFLNLAANARDAMPEGGELRIELTVITLREEDDRPLPEMKPGAWVRILIADSGPGIPPDDLPYVFEPFYSTNETVGAGLGLAQVFGIIRQHDGFILAENPAGGGARYTIYLPFESGEAEEPVLPELAPLQQGRGELILVVEDNEATRQALCEILEMLNYRCLEADNGRRALEVLESREDIALLISDMVMPQMGGKALHEMVTASYPAIKVILMTGYPLGEEDRALLTRKGVVWLGKPLGPEVLAQQIRQTLDAHA